MIARPARLCKTLCAPPEPHGAACVLVSTEGDDVAEWIASFMEKGGYLAVALLMFLENLFPPIPSELIMPLAGYTAEQGDLNVALVIIAGSAGSLAGAVFWYGVARWLGLERLKRFAGRHGRWLTLSPDDIDKADAWFDRHGGKAVCVGRVVPTVRTLISVPAGLSGMTIGRFLVFTSIGTVAWTSILAGAGWMLGSGYEKVGAWINPASNVIVGLILAWYLYRVATFRRKSAG
jgi:membrane protein DedA with SNARE-associated domain